jgi:hypothetical protein
MDKEEQLHKLKRERTWKRNNITRFAKSINSFTGDTSLEDHEYFQGRMKETLERVLKLDDCIHDFLSDDEYYADVEICEDYIDVAKRAIFKSRIIQAHLDYLEDVTSITTAIDKALNIYFISFIVYVTSSVAQIV